MHPHDHAHRLEGDRRLLVGALALIAFVGTAAAGSVVLLTGWDRVDPIARLLAASMFWGAFGLIRESTHVFLEASPGNIDPDDVARAIVAVPEVHEHGPARDARRAPRPSFRRRMPLNQ